MAESRNPRKYKEISVEALAQKARRLHVERYLKRIYGKLPDVLYAGETDSLQTLDPYLTEENLPMLKNYIYLANLEKFSPYMTSEMAKANREMEEDYIGDFEAKSRKRMAAEQVASLLKWDIADVYVDS